MKRLRAILITVLLICTQFSVLVQAESQTNEPSPWAKADIEELKNIVELDPEVFSEYQKSITRVEFIYIAVRIFELLWGNNIAIDPEIHFSDTKDIWAYKGATIGITSGIGGGKFGPDDYLSREQFATMIIRTLQLGKLPLLESGNLVFSDDAQISSWAKSSVYSAKANSIINGVGNNRFAPKELATKEQSLVIINRIIKQFIGEEFNYSITNN